MIKKIYHSIILTLGILMPFSVGASPRACKCHSKNPAMRRMHEVIGYKNCGNCHSKNENLMKSKSSDQKEDHRKKLEKRIKEDNFCKPCHNPDGTIKKESYKKSEAMRITDTFYCPKDKLRFSEGIKVCSKCGGELININKLMEESKKNPSNEICRKCHPTKEVQEIKAHKTDDRKNQYNCLGCHEGHDDCGGCHH